MIATYNDYSEEVVGGHNVASAMWHTSGIAPGHVESLDHDASPVAITKHAPSAWSDGDGTRPDRSSATGARLGQRVRPRRVTRDQSERLVAVGDGSSLPRGRSRCEWSPSSCYGSRGPDARHRRLQLAVVALVVVVAVAGVLAVVADLTLGTGIRAAQVAR